MAKAPKPGVSRRREEADRAALIIEIRVKDTTLRFAPNNLTMSERTAVRKQTGGLPIEAYWSGETAIGIDSLMVMWWLARRANDEPNLLLRTVEETWPDDLEEGDIEMLEITPDDEDAGVDDPEA